MLSIEFISLDEEGNKSYFPVKWYMGKDKGEIEYFRGKYEPYSIQADGYELEYIFSICSNIPHTTKEVQTWHGPFAKFIVENL